MTRLIAGDASALRLLYAVVLCHFTAMGLYFSAIQLYVEDELAYGVIALAVPVYDSARRVVAALNTSSHSKKTTRAMLLKSRLPMLLDVSSRISRELARVPGLALSTRP